MRNLFLVIILLGLGILVSGCILLTNNAMQIDQSANASNVTNSASSNGGINNMLNNASNETPKKYAAPVLKNMLKNCPSEEEVEQFEADFEITSDKAFVEYACANGKNPNYDVSGKLDPRLTVYQTLRLMRALEFSKPLPWTDKSLYEWLKENIKGIHVNKDAEYSFCCSPAKVINLKQDVLTSQYQADWINPQSGSGLVYGIVLMAHEARHTTHGHTCGSSDKTLDEMGAWGVQYYLLYWMANYLPEDFQSDYDRESLAFSAEETKNKRFCD